jgi:hypothetical protein
MLNLKPPENWNIKNGIQQGIVDLQCGLVYSHVFAYMLFYPVFSFIGLSSCRLMGLEIV